jgi:hypothetical protein
MRESPVEHHARTGRDYAPAPWALARGRGLGLRERCPTLFRCPGACGLRDLLRGEGFLAPLSAEVAWFTDAPLHAGAPAAGHFGTLALLEPLALSPVVALPSVDSGGRAAYATANVRFDPEQALWLPPSRLRRPLRWDALSSVREARRALGDDAGERAQVLDAVHAYLDELHALARAGAPGPGRPWLAVPEPERRRLLAAYGVRARWTVERAAAV